MTDGLHRSTSPTRFVEFTLADGRQLFIRAEMVFAIEQRNNIKTKYSKEERIPPMQTLLRVDGQALDYVLNGSPADFVGNLYYERVTRIKEAP